MPPDVALIPFSKYSGAGNDFAIALAEDLEDIEPESLAPRICPRATGVGVDGLILVRRLGPGRIGARFFNPDGSEFSTCGNGSRCVARYARRRCLVEEDRMAIETSAGVVEATAGAFQVSLDYEMDASVEREAEVPYGDELRPGWLVHVGTPHLVLLLRSVPTGDITGLAQPIRFHPSLGPEGVNVDFVSRRGGSETELEIRTYERGVEGETLSCGSGAMAVALALHTAGITGPTLTLHTRSGDALEIALLDRIGEAPSTAVVSRRRRLRLGGPAHHIFDGEFPVPADAPPAGDPPFTGGRSPGSVDG